VAASSLDYYSTFFIPQRRVLHCIAGSLGSAVYDQLIVGGEGHAILKGLKST
jgi:hypothetical protein